MQNEPISSLRPYPRRAVSYARREGYRVGVRTGQAVRVASAAVPVAGLRRSGRIATTAFIAVLLFGGSHASAGIARAPFGDDQPAAIVEVVERDRPRESDDYLRCPSGEVEPINLRDPKVKEQILEGFFSRIGATRTADLDTALLTWVRAEGWDHGWLYNNNPLAMRVTGEGVCGRWNSAGVTIIASLERGVELAAMRLTGKTAKLYGYDKIVRAAREGDPAGFLRAVARSQWNSPSHYGCGEQGDGRNYLGDLWSDVDPDRPPGRVGC